MPELTITIRERIKGTGRFVRSSSEAYLLKKEIGDFGQEVFFAVLLNPKNEIVGEWAQAGTVDQSAVYPREIIRKALELDATAMICYHNHPSGDPDPSQADKDITLALVKASALFGIKALDHIVMAGIRYYSFADHGLMADYESLAKMLSL